MGILSYFIISTPIFIILIFICIIKCFLNIWYYKVYKHILLKREKRAFLVLCMMDIILYTQIIIASVFSLPYSMSAISFIIIYLIQIYSNCQCQNEEEIDVIFNFFGSIYLTLMVLQNCLIIFKIDGLLDWYWRQVFCGYWIMLSILAGAVLIMTLFSLATIEGVFNKRNWRCPLTIDCKKIFVTWLSWAGLFSVMFILIKVLLSFYNFLENKNKVKDKIIISLFMLLIWNFVLIFIILLIKQTLYDIFEELFDQMDEFVENESFYDEESIDIKSKKEKPKVNLNELPKFIQKFTATYFKFKGKKKKANKMRAKKQRMNVSFCVDIRKKNKYFKPKLNSQSFYINRSLNQSMRSEDQNVSKISNHPEKKLDPSESYFLCNVCFGEDSDSVFMECGHGGVCLKCAHDIWNTTGECYLCRDEIAYILRYDNNDKKGNTFKVLELHQEED